MTNKVCLIFIISVMGMTVVSAKSPDDVVRAYIKADEAGCPAEHCAVVSSVVRDTLKKFGIDCASTVKNPPGEAVYAELRTTAITTNGNIAIVSMDVVYAVVWVKKHSKPNADADEGPQQYMFKLGGISRTESFHAEGKGYLYSFLVHEEGEWKFHMGEARKRPMTDKENAYITGRLKELFK